MVAPLAEARALDLGRAPGGDDHRAQSLAEPGGHYLGGERRDRQHTPVARNAPAARLVPEHGTAMPVVSTCGRAPRACRWCSPSGDAARWSGSASAAAAARFPDRFRQLAVTTC